jgi:uncharacterized protein YegP (UPF0339 family)
MRSEDLSQTFAGFDVLLAVDRRAVGRSLEQTLPDSVLAGLYRSGIGIQELRAVRVERIGADPVEEFVSALAASPPKLRSYSGALEVWEPAGDLALARDVRIPVAARPSATFEIYVVEEGRYRWRLLDEHGTVAAFSDDTYETRDDARRAAELLKEIMRDALLPPE